LGTIEPIPGVPPTGRQISALTSGLQGRSGIIIYSPYQSPKAPKSLASNLGWRVVQLPMEPPKGADGDGYLDHMGRWVDAIAGAK
jgi:zinc/manganese transport system substrate-binding protein